MRPCRWHNIQFIYRFRTLPTQHSGEHNTHTHTYTGEACIQTYAAMHVCMYLCTYGNYHTASADCAQTINNSKHSKTVEGWLYAFRYVYLLKGAWKLICDVFLPQNNAFNRKNVARHLNNVQIVTPTEATNRASFKSPTTVLECM